MLETLKSFVNTWECDENNHLNVQFYFERFEDADRHFHLIAGLDPALAGERISRHVRYHRESHVADLQVVRSGLYDQAAGSLTILHVLYDLGSGAIFATALDLYRPPRPLPEVLLNGLPEAPEAERRAARPRSFAEALPALSVSAEALMRSGGFISYYGVVKPAHCTAEGALDDRSLIACISNAAAHVWETAPMTRDWLDRHTYGRVAVEMRLAYGAPVPVGTLTRVISKWSAVQRTSFAFRHHVMDARTGACHAIVEATGLVMDLNTRKAVPLPEDFRASLLKLADLPER